MSHLGHRLSAFIDGELDEADRDRVLVHLAKCEGCRGEAAALRTLKRRMGALGEAAADGALTSRLMGLPQQEAGRSQRSAFGAAAWPQFPTAARGPAPWPPARPLRYAGAGAVAVLLAGLGTAAFLAGGGQAVPEPKVTPSVDTFYVQHDLMTGMIPADQAGSASVRSAPAEPAQPSLSAQRQPAAGRVGPAAGTAAAAASHGARPSASPSATSPAP